MMTRVWTAVQGLTEYGALTGHGGFRIGGQPIGAWAADNRVALLAAAAVLLMLGLVASSRRR